MGILDFFKRKEEKKKENLWTKCEECKSILYIPELSQNFYVCPKCSHHMKMEASLWADMLLEEKEELFTNIYPLDPLNFKDTKKYKERLKSSQEELGITEALMVYKGNLIDKHIILSVMDFRFIGGSMGSVVGEKFKRGALKALELNIPFVSIANSGGARMQEGAISLMQMAKTSLVLKLLDEKKIPYISILTNPTTGGVSASFAFLGDIIIAEPKALIGFAGPRVIEQTIKQQLPENFQTSEFLIEKGMIDMIVERRNLKTTLYKLISYLHN